MNETSGGKQVRRRLISFLSFAMINVVELNLSRFFAGCFGDLCFWKTDADKKVERNV